MSAKQDRVSARTATDIERKYNLRKTFAEAVGLAGNAKRTAENAEEAVDELDEKLDSEEIFNRLTNNGEIQGLFRGEDGELYVNAEFIVALEKLFAKDITMTGQFESTAETYLPPTYEDCVYLLRHVLLPEDYPLPEGFDLNGDGIVDLKDALMANSVYQGAFPMKDCPGAVKTEATLRINMSDPEKLIHISGINMWGSYVETFIGADVNNCSFASREYLNRMIDQNPNESILYRIVDGEKEYLNPPMELGVEYRTAERWLGKVVYAKLIDFGALPASATKNVGHGIESLFTNATPIHFEVFASNGSILQQFPFISSSGTVVGKVHLTDANIVIITRSDVSAYTDTKVLIKYTKG